MVKKRRIHAGETYFAFRAALPLLLWRRELGARCRGQPGAAPAGSLGGVEQQLLESVLQLIDLQDSFDTHAAASASGNAGLLQQPSSVLEMALHNGLLFVLVQSGLCPVYLVTGTTHRAAGLLNQSPHEVIRSLVVNPHDSSVVMVSCNTTNTAVLLHTTSTPAHPRCFRAAGSYCTAGRCILEVVGGWGFVEFDDTCRVALLLNTASMQYKVYDMTTDYRLLFTLPASNIAELKLGSQYLLLLQTQPGSTPPLTSTPAGPHDAQHRQDHGVVVGCGGVPAAEQIHSSEAVLSHEELRVKCPVRKTVRLQVYAAANGQKLAEHVLLLPSTAASHGNPFDVLELCGDKLLLKLPLHVFEVYEVLSMQLCGTGSNEHLSQVSDFLFLQHQHMFMTICGHTITTWNFKGAQVAHFEDHELWYPGMHQSNTLYITDTWVVSLCRAKASVTRLPAASEPGSLHISSLTTGQLLAAVRATHQGSSSSSSQADRQGQGCQSEEEGSSDGGCSPGKPRACGLTDVTSLLFVEGSSTIYTGTQQGLVHCWAPGRTEPP